eukprot:CAMPEP_0182424270 /NCGR_PEP_ID=MMETSP1167-20130531/10446_1 /TAXON_ID=2988 /ORGANISM="Mallomonas Sp, Strain CCMP3275" /LENGTH=261 /DNA_ID=CAMNT_0024603941 /DNA_START=74 /DNA_END=859 /DNA_ORIENTATION=-
MSIMDMYNNWNHLLNDTKGVNEAPVSPDVAEEHPPSACQCRKGKWIAEEEEYANQLIIAFKQGYISVDKKTTLRCFLAGKLNCSLMRISKKFAGVEGLGARFSGATDVSIQDRLLVEANLEQYESKFQAKTGETPATSPRAGKRAVSCSVRKVPKEHCSTDDESLEPDDPRGSDLYEIDEPNERSLDCSRMVKRVCRETIKLEVSGENWGWSASEMSLLNDVFDHNAQPLQTGGVQDTVKEAKKPQNEADWMEQFADYWEE